MVKPLCFYVAQVSHIEFIGHGICSEIKDPFGVFFSINTKYLFLLSGEISFYFCYIHHHKEILK